MFKNKQMLNVEGMQDLNFILRHAVQVQSAFSIMRLNSKFEKHAVNNLLWIKLYTSHAVSRAWYEMEWNGNFGVEYGRCQNGMEDFKSGTEDNLPYFHINSIPDFAHDIYRKLYTDSDNQIY